MDTEKAQALLEKYKEGTCTPGEKAAVDRWYMAEAARQEVPAAPEDPFAEETIIWSRIAQHLFPAAKIRKIHGWKWTAAAASVILCLSLGLFFYHNYLSAEDRKENSASIKAGSHKAILTLADGSKINLNDAAYGTIANQSGLRISKSKDGRIIYDLAAAGSGVKGKADQYNTIETPIGAQYQVNLPDGTSVWLNSASSLRYPVVFDGRERKVELSGEGYFEVAHNPVRPFRVKTRGQEVEVLGTYFNINAYPDESGIRTTLLEGRVKVTRMATKETAYIVPGQQAYLDPQTFNVHTVNLKEVVAWKDGLFLFDHTDLHALMRQISRWYNVKIVYEGEVKNDDFFGEVEMKYNLGEVLKVLELGGLHFRIENAGNQQKILVVIP